MGLAELAEARAHFLEALHINGEAPTAVGRGERAYAVRSPGIVDFREGKLESSLAYCRESMELAVQNSDRNMVASCLGLMALIAATQSRTLRAAKLSGASNALWQRQGRKPWEDSSLDTLLPGWPDRPDQAAIAEALEHGQAMGADEVVAYALGTSN